MAKTKTQRYLVVVVPPKPTSQANVLTTGGLSHSVPQAQAQALSSIQYHVGHSTTVKTLEATSAQEAAEKAGVPAGWTAHVAQLAYVSKFTRPTEAKLEAA